MPVLEMFFDYACPYCLRGYEELLEILARVPDVRVEWYPCEAHPRPEEYGRHSDLLARGMYVVKELGGDLARYHERVYRAAIVEHVDIDNPDAVAELVAGIADPSRFRAALAGGAYADTLRENNRLTWGVCAFDAVPSYRMNGKLLGAVPGVGVHARDLEAFIRE